jgi:hypothetical protein
VSWVEFNCRVECPHCNYEEHDCVEFNMNAADSCGVNSPLLERQCQECAKKFWFRAYLSFDVEVSDSYIKKPKTKSEAKP